MATSSDLHFSIRLKEAILSELSGSAAEMLLGLTLNDGWRVVERIERRPGATGGSFSVGYRVEHPDGRRGFCKALDYSKALSAPDTPAAMRTATEEYIFERDLHHKCEDLRMSRVVVALADGIIFVADSPIPRVDYIILEYAAYDIRQELDQDADLEAILRLRSLHHVAVALRQLHQHKIAHQDVKPSNILVFINQDKDRSSKVGDLGRATDASRPALHDVADIVGDRNYAPPEQLYRATPTEFGPRRLACDLYQLGSLATFMFTTASMNSLLSLELSPGHTWFNWTGTYEEVLPYVRDAFGKALEKLRSMAPPSIADDITALVSYLCDPDPALRGYPENRRLGHNSYGLQRVVTKLDLLARRVALTKSVVPV